MTKRHRLVLMIACVLIMGCVGAFSMFTIAQSQTQAAVRGPFMLANGDRLMVWRIDQSTGRVSYCMRDSVSTDPKFIATRAPFCSAWSE